jgi:uncharacterized membrane protein YGL010W
MIDIIPFRSIQVLAWAIQVVIGHGIFENRKPALLDSLFQALVSPFFVVLEFMFLFGMHFARHRHALNLSSFSLFTVRLPTKVARGHRESNVVEN